MDRPVVRYRHTDRWVTSPHPHPVEFRRRADELARERATPIETPGGAVSAAFQAGDSQSWIPSFPRAGGEVRGGRAGL
jgi:hypothetical protein